MLGHAIIKLSWTAASQYCKHAAQCKLHVWPMDCAQLPLPAGRFVADMIAESAEFAEEYIKVSGCSRPFPPRQKTHQPTHAHPQPQAHTF